MNSPATKQTAAPIANDRDSRDHVQILVLMAATALGIYPCFTSLFGGMILSGPAGIILGPVVLTTTMVLLEIGTARTSASVRNRAR
jgi:predicted PurR-regulated permease PerM